MPSWLHETTVYNIRLSEAHFNQPPEGTIFEFPEPGHFSALSNKEKLQVRLDGIAFDSKQQWVFKLSDRTESSDLDYFFETIPQMDLVKKVILHEDGSKLIGMQLQALFGYTIKSFGNIK